jgi:hypothetical protein
MRWVLGIYLQHGVPIPSELNEVTVQHGAALIQPHGLMFSDGYLALGLVYCYG